LSETDCFAPALSFDQWAGLLPIAGSATAHSHSSCLNTTLAAPLLYRRHS